MRKSCIYFVDSIIPIFGVIFFLTGYLVIKYAPDVSILYNSSGTPWGIFTSVFIYDGPGNVVYFTILFLFFFVENITYDQSVRLWRSLLTIGVSLSSALVANVFDLILFTANSSNARSYGQSGVIYAFWGIIFILSMLYLFDHFKSFKQIMKKVNGTTIKVWPTKKSLLIISCLFATIIFSYTLFYISVYPRRFLSAAPDVNYFVHIISFIAGSLIFYGFSVKYKKQTRSMGADPLGY